MSATKLGLKGFSNCGFIPVVNNTEGAYSATGEIVRLTGAQSCTVEDTKTSYSIPGDDGVYDSGSEWESTNLTLTVAEMSLSQLSALTGSTYDSEDDLMEECAIDDAPENAITFSALRRDGGYRMYRYYCAKLTGYKVAHSTKGQNAEQNNQSYELSFICTPRKFDGNIRASKDVAKGTALTWLDTIPAMPVVEDDA